MLAEKFIGRSAQFLAILESLTNTNRRTIQTCIGAPEADDCLHDVYLELFFAGVEIVAGGGGIKPVLPGRSEVPIHNVVTGLSLIELASAGRKYYVEKDNQSKWVELIDIIRLMFLYL